MALHIEYTLSFKLIINEDLLPGSTSLVMSPWCWSLTLSMPKRSTGTKAPCQIGARKFLKKLFCKYDYSVILDPALIQEN